MCIATKNGNSNITNTTITKGKEHHRNRSTSSALQRMAPLILSGYLFNTLCYFLLYTILPSNLTPVPKYCPLDNPHCKRHGLLAFQLVSLLNLSYLGLLGVYTFFISKRALNELPQTPQGRYFGNVLTEGRVLLPEADWICAVIVIFQGWDFVVSMFFEEHCTRIMMCHHFLAFICGFFCLVYEVNPFYAVYIGGVSEFSSIFLCISQFFQFCPPASLVSPSSSYVLPILHLLSAIEAFSQIMFVISFLMFRIVGWAYLSYLLCKDGSYIMKHGLCRRYSPGSGWFLWYLLACSLGLGALQVFWVRGIVNKVLEVMNGN
mmetsp:Transcript_11644/g.18911  ORF Transcript_11644/g.18911 Transcript_11644/m.18911 type:complete len:319 (-) Transcript_11644:211-1167(-)|eukprot:CAMPEP_0196137248 /NCGR_PEP_ID=MMETSP0910-20130528/5299_1 /TAXON_ID=49265 /ORGANISM="Thalassiosira rotula, Strain GSO102" /LENGTH=318 /DNA_ID=CAMNT_0041397685 /DNA_START=91 /DNA_END=1047 /DNA_ORIENTATION=+